MLLVVMVLSFLFACLAVDDSLLHGQHHGEVQCNDYGAEECKDTQGSSTAGQSLMQRTSSLHQDRLQPAEDSLSKCLMQKDCSISAWCKEDYYESWCATRADCPMPQCYRDGSSVKVSCFRQTDCSISSHCHDDSLDAWCATRPDCPAPWCMQGESSTSVPIEASSTASPTPSPISMPTPAPVPQPTPGPTPQPMQPTPEPTPEHTPEPTPEPTPQTAGEVCIGDPEVDEILTAAGVKTATRLEGSTVYNWEGFCVAARAIASVGLPLYVGTGSGAKRVAQVLSNIASLLAQSMWESGGEAPWSACDENNYLSIETAPCTQRSDGQRYDSLTSPPACVVDPQMHMIAETYASWTPGPMSCVPGTVTEGCCWWGRGAIQTTGPHNYKKLQDDVVSKVSDVDLCTNPEAICQHDQLKWLGAMYYWTSVVQKDASFERSLAAYVDTGFSDEGSVLDGASFNAGTGGVVNNGFWSATPHGNAGRMAYFHQLVEAMHAAGMGGATSDPSGGAASDPSGGATSDPSGCEASCRPQGETCYVQAWSSPCFTPADGKAGCDAFSGDFCG